MGSPSSLAKLVPPGHLLQLKRPEFEAWLIANGCQIRPATNDYEVIRYVAPFKVRGKEVFTTTHILYKKASGKLTWGQESYNHYVQFLRGIQLELVEVPLGSPIMKLLIERDGPNCFYCDDPLGEDQTIEHLLPKSEGGNNKPANLAAAHCACNIRAGSLSVVEKVKLRDRIRREKGMVQRDPAVQA